MNYCAMGVMVKNMGPGAKRSLTNHTILGKLFNVFLSHCAQKMKLIVIKYIKQDSPQEILTIYIINIIKKKDQFWGSDAR